MPSQSRVYIPGDRWVECGVCGFDYRFTQMKKQRGVAVCPECFDSPGRDDSTVEKRTEGKIAEVQ